MPFAAHKSGITGPSARVAPAFGLRGTFVATGVLFLLTGLFAGPRLPEPGRPQRAG